MDDAEFEAALAAQLGPDEETPDVETEPEETPEEETVSDVADEPDPIDLDDSYREIELVPTESQYSDEVSSYLGKYGGDVGKALEAALHAQAKLGEQGQELGELRRAVQELYDRPEPRQQTSPFVSEQVQEAIDDNPGRVAAWALQNNDQAVYEAAVREWYDQDPMSASRFEIAMNREMLRAEMQAESAATNSAVQDQQRSLAVVNAHKALSQKYPDFQQTLESATADEVAGINRNLLAASSPEEALELVYRWVASGRGQQAATQAAQVAEQNRQTKKAAAVVTGETTTESTVEPTALEKLEAFMLTPDAWSVSDGLTR